MGIRKTENSGCVSEIQNVPLINEGIWIKTIRIADLIIKDKSMQDLFNVSRE